MFNELIDSNEQKSLNIDNSLLSILLIDNTTKKNIIWATNNYSSKGCGFHFKDNITIEKVTGLYQDLVKPRIKKNKEERLLRIKEKAEVFTPSWVCNKQNNLIDNDWLGYENAFNYEDKDSWTRNNSKIKFSSKTWQDYLKAKRLEISCGEAPYLVSRYDTVSGKIIDIENRIGLLDRKFRVLNENIDDYDEWISWSKEVIKSIFGYEWQGDNLLIARKNVLYTYIDNYTYKFNKKPDYELIKNIAKIISWNLWQMDGIKYVIPETCTTDKISFEQLRLYGKSKKTKHECYGCKKGNIRKHNGIYSKIMNWNTKRAIKFINVINK